MTTLQQLTLHGDPEVHSRIVCTWQAGFAFTNMSELHISALAFISCGHHRSAAVLVWSVQQGDIANCTFQNSINTVGNTRDYQGGALFLGNSTLTLTRNTFYNNVAISGGALYVKSSTLMLSRNAFYNNFATYGGAFEVEYSTLTLTGNTFYNNSANLGGGAIRARHGTLNLTGNTFQYNSAGDDGGALVAWISIINLTRNTFQNNTACDSGGAQYMYDGTLHSVGNHFQNSHAAFGGTLHVYKSHAALTDDCFSDSYAQFQGGAVLVTVDSIVDMHNITIENNEAKYGGGMAAVDSQLKVFENAFQNNRARYGGGLYVHNTEFNGTAIIAKNSASEGGGGIYASMSTFSFMDNTTIITKNSAKDGGGLLLSGDSKLYQKSGSAVHFTSNSAMSTGGAIKVEESDPLTYCIPLTTSFYVSNSECFFQIQQKKIHFNHLYQAERYVNSLNITMYFDNNTAVEGGSDLHGGSVDNCKINTFIFNKHYEDSTALCGYYFDAMSENKNSYFF